MFLSRIDSPFSPRRGSRGGAFVLTAFVLGVAFVVLPRNIRAATPTEARTPTPAAQDSHAPVQLIVGRAHQGAVTRIVRHPTLALFASTGDHRVLLWDSRAHSPVRELVSPVGNIQDVQFSDAGQGLVAFVPPEPGRSAYLLRWPLEGGEAFPTVQPLPEARGMMSALRADGAMLLNLSWSDLKLYETATGRVLYAVRLGGSDVTSLFLDEHGTYAALGRKNGTIELLPLQGPGGKPVSLEGHSKSVTALAATRDGRLLASVDQGGEVRLWGGPDWHPLGVLGRHGASGSSLRAPKHLAFDAREERLTSFAHDDTLVFDLGSKSLLARLKLQYPEAGAFLDADTILAESGGTIVAHPIRGEPPLFNAGIDTRPRKQTHIAFNPEGDRLHVISPVDYSEPELFEWSSSGAREIHCVKCAEQLISTPAGPRVLQLPGFALQPLDARVLGQSSSVKPLPGLPESYTLDWAVVLDQGRRLLLNADRKLYFFDLPHRRMLNLPKSSLASSAEPHPFATLLCAPQEGGSLVALAIPSPETSLVEASYQVEIWDASRGTSRAFPARTPWFSSALALDPSGRRLAMAQGALVHFFDARTGQEGGAPMDLGFDVKVLRYSPKGDTLMAAGVGHLAAIDATTGRTRWTQLSSQGSITSIAFHPREPLVATGSSSHVSLWSLATGNPWLALHAFYAPDQRNDEEMSLAWVAATSEGRFELSPESLPFISVARGLQTLGAQARDAWVNPGLLASFLGRNAKLGNEEATAVQVRFLTPEPGSRVGSRQVNVGFELSDPHGTSNRVVLSINGRPAWTDLLLPSKGPRPPSSRTTAVGLENGLNHLELVARDAYDRVLARARLEVTLEWTGPGERIEVVPPIGHTLGVISAAFSPDGRWLASVGEDRTVRLWDVMSGRLIQVLGGMPLNPEEVAFSPDGNQVIARGATERLSESDRLEATCIWERASGRLRSTVTGRFEGPEQDWFPSRKNREDRFDTNIRTAQLEVKELGSEMLAVTDVATGLRRCTLPRTGSALALSNDSRLLADIGRTDIAFWDTRSCSLVRSFSIQASLVMDLAWPAGSRQLLMRREHQILSLSFDTGQLAVLRTDDTLNVYNQGLDGYSTLAASSDGGMLVLGHRGELQWTAQKDTAGRRFVLPKGAYALDARISGQRKLLAARIFDVISQQQSQRLALFELTGAMRELHLLDSNRTVEALAFDARGERLFAGARAPSSQGGGEGGDLGHALFNPGFDAAQHEYVDSSGDAELLVWPAREGARPQHFTVRGHGSILSLAAHPTRQELALGFADGTVVLWDSAAHRQLSELNLTRGAVFSLAYSPDGRYLAQGGADGVVHVVTPSAQPRVVHALWGHSSSVYEVIWSPDSERLVSASRDGTLRVWNATAGTEIALAFISSETDLLLALPSGVYMGSKQVAASVGIRIGERVVPFEQFDLAHNQPHAVLAALGSKDEALMKTYQEAHARRLRELGAGETSAAPRLAELPRLSLRQWEVHGRQLNLRVQATPGSGGALRAIFPSVNDIPLPAVPWTGSPAVQEQELQIALAHGRNRLRLSLSDAAGQESLAEILDIMVDGPPPPRTLYLLAVGVSHYEQSSFDLRFADNDALSLAGFFAQHPGSFSQVKARTLVNDKARKSHVLEAASMLREATVDDVVVVFIAGHGLKSGGEYYFAPHDMDFTHPREKGLSFAELESLLEKTPARQRLLLMDTCHSGPIDAEAEPPVPTRPAEGVALLPAPRGAESLDLKETTSFEAMRALFTDLSRGTGTLVLSAASGQQPAYEREGHGAFTQSLLDALEKGSADLDQDGAITVSELQRTVAEVVRRSTGSAQVPTFRRDVLDTDFSLAQTPGLLARTRLPSGSSLWGLTAEKDAVAVRTLGGLFRFGAQGLNPLGLWRQADDSGRQRWLGVSLDGRLRITGELRFHRAQPSDSLIEIRDSTQETLEGTLSLPGNAHMLSASHFSRDGKRVALTSADGPNAPSTLTVVALPRGQVLRVWKDIEALFRVQLDDTGQRLSAVTSQGVLMRWNVETGEELVKLQAVPSQWQLHNAAVSDDGRHAAVLIGSGSQQRIRLYDLEKGSLLRELQISGIYAVALDALGGRLATGARDGTLQVWDVATGSPQLTFTAGRGDVDALLFLADGTRLVTLSRRDAFLRLWDVAPRAPHTGGP